MKALIDSVSELQLALLEIVSFNEGLRDVTSFSKEAGITNTL